MNSGGGGGKSNKYFPSNVQFHHIWIYILTKVQATLYTLTQIQYLCNEDQLRTKAGHVKLASSNHVKQLNKSWLNDLHEDK